MITPFFFVVSQKKNKFKIHLTQWRRSDVCTMSSERDAQLTAVYMTAWLMTESGMTSTEDVHSFGAMIRANLVDSSTVNNVSAVNNVPEIPPEFLCPITKQVMHDPVIVFGSGQTYEREAIENWFQGEIFRYNSLGTRACNFVMTSLPTDVSFCRSARDEAAYHPEI